MRNCIELKHKSSKVIKKNTFKIQNTSRPPLRIIIVRVIVSHDNKTPVKDRFNHPAAGIDQMF